MRKQYTSLEEINSDLKILEVKREIHYQKIFQSVDDIKEELSPDRLVKNTVGSIANFVKSSGSLQAFVITTVLKYLFKKRRQ
ncbi:MULTISPECIES: DUF6327 family protein [Myroides]|uniref:Glutaminyl-tRNA synthetase n=1 Tax=Myroides albus TaxID=2562892 RepID=A0A6I3LJ92_9FLAO|nr:MULTISPECIES: DUF6327 family protein [Myroides]MTG96541.1 hypothetical protein [Myroides albus]MVX34537.1 hypothetical protein [Myroides sp. LoEW2-1]UVD81045.1 DUF6327 family protein [Myroides albus]